MTECKKKPAILSKDGSCAKVLIGGMELLITEKIFLGLQFKSQYYSKSSLENVVVDAVTAADIEIKRLGLSYVRLEPNLVEIKPAEGVTEAILKKIEESLVCIFEISDNNPNVMLELGSAYTHNKRLIILKNEESVPVSPVPSDIVGKFITYYGGVEYPSLERLKPKIAKIVSDYIIDEYNKRSEAWARKIWDIKGDRLTVASGNLHGKYEVEPLDADALLEATLFMVNLYPGLKVKRVYSLDFAESDYYGNDVLAIGGSDTNRVTAGTLKRLGIEFPYEYVNTEEPDDFILRDRKEGKDRRTARIGDAVVKDYGFFVKSPNPYSAKDRNVILVTGMQSEGTLGCVKALPAGHIDAYDIRGSPLEALLSKKHFTFVVEATIDAGQVAARILTDSIYFLGEQ